MSCHIIESPGDTRALCGVKKPTSLVARRWASAHRYEIERCVECYTSAGLADMLPQGECPGQIVLFEDGAA